MSGPADEGGTSLDQFVATAVAEEISALWTVQDSVKADAEQLAAEGGTSLNFGLTIAHSPHQE